MAEITRIEPTTAIHDFPDIYNGNNQELLDRITALEQQLTNIEAEYQTKIRTMKNNFEAWVVELQRSFDKRFDDNIADLEKTFAVKTSTVNDTYLTSINTRLVEVESKINLQVSIPSEFRASTNVSAPVNPGDNTDAS